MSSSPVSAPRATPALDALTRHLAERRASNSPPGDFGAQEVKIREMFTAAHREALEEELARHDPKTPMVRVDGVEHRRVLEAEETYITAVGPVRVSRGLYRARGEGRTICPMELSAGIIEGLWSPLAGEIAAFMLALIPAHEAEELLGKMGGMAPSRATLDRLPRAFCDGWEAQRSRFEECVREESPVPADAVAVCLSLDGVMLAMKDGNRAAKRQASIEAGREPRGPAGFREASCGTLSFYDRAGERIGDTIYLGRMPEVGKRSLKASLEDELAKILNEREDLKVVAVADGARDNWPWMDRALPAGSRQVIDYFHAAQHLAGALDAAHGEGSTASRAEYERLRVILRDQPGGVDVVINALAYQHKKFPRRLAIKRELAYFRSNRHRMDYAELVGAKLPIGSGVVEAANKTLVVVRMKRAGARWGPSGGQGVLTLRALAKSRRFDRGWRLFAATFQQGVHQLHPAVTPRLEAA